MSHRHGDVFVAQDMGPAICELCGRVGELRPYGPNGEQICHDCGMKDPATTFRKMTEAIEGASLVVVKLDTL
jgi:hypothetical protein